ncbi:MAG: hypothetical protein IJO00_02615 [Clostridia bacterium]|nr:hypothetical protein [Clostridia bacterium]
MNTDTKKLLKECNSGCKSAVDSIDQIKDRISSPELRKRIEECSRLHTEIGERCHTLLSQGGSGDSNPPAIGMAMAHIGTEIKLAVNNSDSHIAEMMADGAAMGMKSISKVLNLYPNASDESKNIAVEIVREERGFFNDMLGYL